MFARRVWTKALTMKYRSTPGARLKFRADELLPHGTRAVAHVARIEDLSSILHGAILAVDPLLVAAKERDAMQYDFRVQAVSNG